MKAVHRFWRPVLVVVAGVSQAALAACDVTVRPFEFAETDDGGATGVDSDVGSAASDAAAGKEDAGTADAGCLPRFEARPPVVDFGAITNWCNSREVSVSVMNTGCAELIITEASVVPDSVSFDLVSIRPVPFVLYPGEKSDARLVFHAQPADGVATADLRFTGPTGVFEIPLLGTATPSSSVVDQYVQGAPEATTFHLSRWPDPGTIGVMVNDKVVNEGHPAGWEYDGDRNNVIFGPNAVPPPEWTVKVSYEAECL